VSAADGTKAIELWTGADIDDMAYYALGVANGGSGTDGKEFESFSGSLDAGTHIWVAQSHQKFTQFFGHAPTYVWTDLDISGDDAVELFLQDTVADVYGRVDMGAPGQGWHYTSGWAYRKPGTGPDGSAFQLSSWMVEKNALMNAPNSACGERFPIGNFIFPCGYSPSPELKDSPVQSPFVSFQPSPHDSPGTSPEPPDPSVSPDQCYPIDEEIGGSKVFMQCPYGSELLENGTCYISCGVVICPGYDEYHISGLCYTPPSPIPSN
jgi:hypothetical protein